MEKNKKYKNIIIIAIILVLGGAILLAINNKQSSKNNLQVEVKDLPLEIESTPLSFNIVDENGVKVLKAIIKNNSQETISRITLDVKLKDTGEVIEMKYNEPIAPGEESKEFSGKAPNSGNIEDVEVLKYEISLTSGIYMEYDVNLRQYNWS